RRSPGVVPQGHFAQHPLGHQLQPDMHPDTYPFGDYLQPAGGFARSWDEPRLSSVTLLSCRMPEAEALQLPAFLVGQSAPGFLPPDGSRCSWAWGLTLFTGDRLS